MSYYFPSQDFPAAPIHSLPVELLSYIFTLSAHTSFVADDDVAEPSPSDFPFDPANMLTTIAISTVSRYWRDVALSTPALWTDICVSTELPDDDDEESRQLRNTMKPNAYRIATYLARSGNAPIDILISARDPDWDFSETECVKFHQIRPLAIFANLTSEFL
jgi:F-box-like